MPLFKFTGAGTLSPFPGIVFADGKPTEVTDPEQVRRLSQHPEFEEVKAKAEKAENSEAGKPVRRKAAK